MSKPNTSRKAPLAASTDSSPMTNAKFRKLASRYTQALRNDGPTALASELRSTALYQLHKHLLDRLAAFAEPGNVSHITELDGLTIDSEHRVDGVQYVPTPHRVFGWIQDLLPGDTSNWAFVDVGAGRGRVIAAAAGYPYRLVLGVEFAAELQRDATLHIASIPAKARRADKVDVIHADAADFDIPAGPCIFYLFNPFGAAVLRKFLINVVRSYEGQPRQMCIAYFNPKHADVMAEFGQIHKCKLPMKARMKFAALSPNKFELYKIA